MEIWPWDKNNPLCSCAPPKGFLAVSCSLKQGSIALRSVVFHVGCDIIMSTAILSSSSSIKTKNIKVTFPFYFVPRVTQLGHILVYHLSRCSVGLNDNQHSQRVSLVGCTYDYSQVN